MSHVFISYSKKNYEYARALADYLLEQGFDVWIDDDDITDGARWKSAIEQGIRECSVFLVVMTPDAERSEWVESEVELARDLEKPLLALWLEGEIWWWLKHLQVTDVRDRRMPKNDFFEKLSQYAPRQRSARGMEKSAQTENIQALIDLLYEQVEAQAWEAADATWQHVMAGEPPQWFLDVADSLRAEIDQGMAPIIEERRRQEEERRRKEREDQARRQYRGLKYVARHNPQLAAQLLAERVWAALPGYDPDQLVELLALRRYLLLTWSGLQARFAEGGLSALLADCDLFPDDRPIRLLRQALTLSVNVVSEHKDQLAVQLLERLRVVAESEPEIAQLRESIFAPLYLINHDPIFEQAGGQLLATFQGHTDWVWGALELGDGTLLSWSYDGTLRRWSADGDPLATFQGHTKAVRGALELGDGTLLSWSSDRTLRRWSLDGETLATFQGHTAWVRGALALGGGEILSWSYDGTLRRWSADGEELAMLVVGSGYRSQWDRAQVFAWTREQGFDANVFFSEKKDPHVAGGRVALRRGVIYVYDVASGETLARFVGENRITCLAVTRDAQGEVVVAGDEFGRVYFLRWARA